MGSLDPAKLLVVFVVALIVLGPERLPRVARQLGGALRELTRMREQVTEEIRSALPDDLPTIPRMPKNMVSGFISDLTKPTVSGVGGDASGTGVESGIEEHGDELVSSSSTGTSDGGGAANAGEYVTHPWERAASEDGFRRPARRPAAKGLDDLPVAFDDASMN